MPTKIVSTSSKYLNGEIKKEDLDQIIDQFKNHVILSTDNGSAITKINEIHIPIEIVEHLLNGVTASQRTNCKVIVKFGVTLPDQKDCMGSHNPVGNHLTVAIHLNNNGVDLTEAGNFVITTGFREFESGDNFTDGACCPVIDPGHT